MICPKCGHQRTQNDDPAIPDYQCPACDIIYAKYKPPGSQNKEISASAIENTHRTKRYTQPPQGNVSNQSEIIIEGQIVTPLFTNKLKIIAACGIILITVAKSYASPSTFMEDFHTALIEQDASDLAKYIDFEKLKINTKAEINATLTQKSEQKNNPFFQMGQAIGNQMVDAMIDKTISPAGIKAMFQQQIKGQKKPQDMPIFDFRYVNFNKVDVDLGEAVTRLERTGYFSWIIVAINKK